MALPTGLLPTLAFVLTVGVSLPVALGARSFARADAPFSAALWSATLEAAALYLVGVLAAWAIAGAWTVAATLAAVGLAAAVLLVALPILAGQRLLRRLTAADSETALRYATYGWPAAMAVAFGVFVAPGGFDGGHLLDLGGARTCLAGFCGISVPLLLTLCFEFLVVALGPGFLGVGLYSSLRSAPRDRTRS